MRAAVAALAAFGDVGKRRRLERRQRDCGERKERRERSSEGSVLWSLKKMTKWLWKEEIGKTGNNGIVCCGEDT